MALGMLLPSAETPRPQEDDPYQLADIKYLYDWSSIFANPEQEAKFVRPYQPYAKGGQVEYNLDIITNILRGGR